MAEEISDIVSRLRIDTEEEEVIDAALLNPNPVNNVSLLLLGRLLTERSFNVEAFKRTITTVWAPTHGLVIRVLRPNLFAFQFYHWKDMMKVLDGRPWCFDNMLVVLKEADGDEPPDQVTLYDSPFWIRLKNLPFNMRSDAVVRALIGNLGEILEIEEDVLGFGRYRRVKVMLDINKPLRRFRKIKDKKGAEIQIDFAYERLPFFCLACGIMGHSEKDCHNVVDEDKCEKLGWHLGLKATPRKGRTKEMEEEVKYKNCRKILFDASCMKREKQPANPKHLTLTENSNGTEVSLLAHSTPVSDLHDIVGTDPKDNSKVSPQTELTCVFNASALNDQVATPLGATHDSNITGDGLCFPNLFGPSSPRPDVDALNVTPTTGFTFTSTKAAKKGKAHSWKRLARNIMDEKGSAQLMDMDPAMIVMKRQLEHDHMIGEEFDSAMKRPKLSTSHASSIIDPAEIGVDQSRPSL